MSDVMSGTPLRWRPRANVETAAYVIHAAWRSWVEDQRFTLWFTRPERERIARAFARLRPS
jgi:hypothetical protein